MQDTVKTVTKKLGDMTTTMLEKDASHKEAKARLSECKKNNKEVAGAIKDKINGLKEKNLDCKTQLKLNNVLLKTQEEQEKDLALLRSKEKQGSDKSTSLGEAMQLPVKPFALPETTLEKETFRKDPLALKPMGQWQNCGDYLSTPVLTVRGGLCVFSGIVRHFDEQSLVGSNIFTVPKRCRPTAIRRFVVEGKSGPAVLSIKRNGVMALQSAAERQAGMGVPLEKGSPPMYWVSLAKVVLPERKA